MNTQDVQQDKLTLINWISQSQNSSLIKKLKSLFEEEAVVAYSTDGKPLTLKQYNQALEMAEKDIEKGRTISTDELRKKVARWKK